MPGWPAQWKMLHSHPSRTLCFVLVRTHETTATSGLKSYIVFGLNVEHMDLVSTRPGWEGGENNGKDAETVKQLPAWVGTVTATAQSRVVGFDYLILTFWVQSQKPKLCVFGGDVENSWRRWDKRGPSVGKRQRGESST